jgi:hypothetical protein
MTLQVTVLRTSSVMPPSDGCSRYGTEYHSHHGDRGGVKTGPYIPSMVSSTAMTPRLDGNQLGQIPLKHLVPRRGQAALVFEHRGAESSHQNPRDSGTSLFHLSIVTAKVHTIWMTCPGLCSGFVVYPRLPYVVFPVPVTSSELARRQCPSCRRGSEDIYTNSTQLALLAL